MSTEKEPLGFHLPHQEREREGDHWAGWHQAWGTTAQLSYPGADQPWDQDSAIEYAQNAAADGALLGFIIAIEHPEVAQQWVDRLRDDYLEEVVGHLVAPLGLPPNCQTGDKCPQSGTWANQHGGEIAIAGGTTFPPGLDNEVAIWRFIRSRRN